MKSMGQHLLVEYQGCNLDILNDIEKIASMMKEAAVAAKANAVATVFHPYTPQGISGVVVIEESHLSIHTWPEYGYAAVDFFTCGDCEPMGAHEVIKKRLHAERWEKMMIHRGLIEEEQSMTVIEHK
jgi:S-adenosylmethionine decarboxylase